jgi:prepilin-type processing-associated H-X9-DG protein
MFKSVLCGFFGGENAPMTDGKDSKSAHVSGRELASSEALEMKIYSLVADAHNKKTNFLFLDSFLFFCCDGIESDAC